MSDPHPFAYDLVGCPHDCGWVGELSEAEPVTTKDYARDIYRCPKCSRKMKVG